MATKGGREKIKLESTAGTGHFYTTSKNKKTTPEKLEFLKFDPKARKHVLYKEVHHKLGEPKLPQGSGVHCGLAFALRVAQRMPQGGKSPFRVPKNVGAKHRHGHKQS